MANQRQQRCQAVITTTNTASGHAACIRNFFMDAQGLKGSKELGRNAKRR